MHDWIMDNEPLVRIGAFGLVLLVMASWELLRPRRHLTTSKLVRWATNLLIVAIDTLLVRMLFPLAAVGVALLAESRGWGLLGQVNLPYWVAVIAGFVALDLIIYLQHVMFHAVPALWQIHSMHHVDLDFDVTTGLRFHPVEILLSMVIKLAAIAALGPPAVAVLLFEVVLNATAMFNHSNIRLPLPIDRVLRWVMVTPDMHRVHHSTDPAEHNRNFGFNLPWWDRLLGTYRAQPAMGHEGMRIGLGEYRDPKRLTFHWLLVFPWWRGQWVRPSRSGERGKEQQ